MIFYAYFASLCIIASYKPSTAHRNCVRRRVSEILNIEKRILFWFWQEKETIRTCRKRKESWIENGQSLGFGNYSRNLFKFLKNEQLLRALLIHFSFKTHFHEKLISWYVQAFILEVNGLEFQTSIFKRSI